MTQKTQTGFSAEVVKHSSYKGREIITMALEYPRIILAQINTSRQLAKNTASSRAQTTKSLLEQDIFIPEKVGVNKPGMEATEYLTGKELKRFQKLWVGVYNKVAKDVQKIQDELNVHKQTTNRLLEVFSFTKSVLTGTKESWEHLLALRLEHSTQPEYQLLAQLIDTAISESIPQELKVGQWHLPFVDSVEAGEGMINVKTSVSMCAQTSYRKADDSQEKTDKIYNMLNLVSGSEAPPHISPTQHQCLAADPELHKQQPEFWSEMGGFSNPGFVQYSKILENTVLKKKEEK